MFGTASDGGAIGANTGYDQITNFQSGTDTITLTGALRAAVDKNANSQLSGASRVTNAINISTDEVAVLSTVVSSLTDTSLLAVRSEIGILQNSAAGVSLTVLANNGTNTGLYVVTDTNGDGVVAATEIALLGVFNGVSNIGFTDLGF